MVTDTPSRQQGGAEKIAHTQLQLTVLWDDIERTHEYRHFGSVEDLAMDIKSILKGGNRPGSGVASLTIATKVPRGASKGRA